MHLLEAIDFMKVTLALDGWAPGSYQPGHLALCQREESWTYLHCSNCCYSSSEAQISRVPGLPCLFLSPAQLWGSSPRKQKSKIAFWTAVPVCCVPQPSETRVHLMLEDCILQSQFPLSSRRWMVGSIILPARVRGSFVFHISGTY